MKTKLSYVLGAILILMTGVFSGRLASAQIPATPAAVTPASRFQAVAVGVIPVRAAAEMTVTASTKRYGFEVYEDTANGNLIYITEAGSIAVVHPAK